MNRILAEVFDDALRGIDLARIVADALGREPMPKAARLVAIGKAAPAMAKGALSAWPSVFERVIVVAPDGTPCELVGIELLRAGHPLPDARSVDAANRVLELCDTCAGATVVALISGGASALVCAPADGVTLEEKIAVTRDLLASGASIVEMNAARRRLSRIKGGRLAERVARAGGRMIAFVASDVIGGSVGDVGSGPTVSASSRTTLVLEPGALASSAARALAARGFSPRVLPPSTEPVEALAAEYARLATSLAPGEAVVRIAEPSVRVTVTPAGRGGRATHLAALLLGHLPADVAFLAGASDGVDATSGTMGAIVDASVATDPARIADALAAFDTGALHLELGTALPAAPTGINMCDLHVIARAPIS